MLIYCYIKRVGQPTLLYFFHHKAYSNNTHQYNPGAFYYTQKRQSLFQGDCLLGNNNNLKYIYTSVLFIPYNIK